MKRLAFLLPVALSACFSPDDIFVLDGTLVAAAPEGQPVRLYRGKPDDDRVCRQLTLFKETTADAAGRYTFELFRAQAQSLNGVTKDPCFSVQAEFPSFTVAAIALAQVFGPEELPPLPDWRPNPQLGEGWVVRFEPVTTLPAEETLEGPFITHRLEVTDASSRLAWRQDDLLLEPGGPGGMTLARVPLRFDPFTLIEEQSVVGRLEARITQRGDGRGGPFEGRPGFGRTVEVIAGQVLTLTELAPHPTRDRPCRAFGNPCRLTDGDYAPTPPDFETNIMELEPPDALVPGRLVLRGLETSASSFGVELKDLGGVLSPRVDHALPVSAWDPTGAALELPLADGTMLQRGGPPKHFLVVPLDATTPQAVVRLRFSSPVTRLGELSALE